MVWPFSSGEVIVQNYNAILSLSRLYHVSDGLLLFDNDRVQKVCQVMHKLKTVTVNDLNQVRSRWE